MYRLIEKRCISTPSRFARRLIEKKGKIFLPLSIYAKTGIPCPGNGGGCERRKEQAGVFGHMRIKWDSMSKKWQWMRKKAGIFGHGENEKDPYVQMWTTSRENACQIGHKGAKKDPYVQN